MAPTRKSTSMQVDTQGAGNSNMPPTPAKERGRSATRKLDSSRSRSRTKSRARKRKSSSASSSGKNKKIRHKRKRHTGVGRLIARGIQSTREFGEEFVVIDADGKPAPAGYLGHATTALAEMAILMWMAIMKALFLKSGKTVPSPTEGIDGILAEDVWNVSYTLYNGEKTEVEVISAALAGNTLLAIAGYMADDARPWNGVNYQAATQVHFRDIEYKPAINIATTPTTILTRSAATTLTLWNSSVEYFIKSELKMQNRTIAEAGDDEVTRVDRVPIYAKIYEGKGNGPLGYLRDDGSSTKNMNWIGDSSNGVIKNSSDAFTREPPSKKELKAKNGKRVTFDPGDIQTSILTTRFKVPMSKFFNKIGPVVSKPDGTNVTIYPRSSFGEYRLFGFDKMIETLGKNDADRQPITIAYEVNRYTVALFKPGKNKMTTQLYVFDDTVDG